MIVICDRDGSERARILRERMLEKGIPSAVSAPVSVKKLLPAAAILTWCELFEDLRRTPCDHVYAAVIGTGFVNTAQNAGRVPDENAALAVLREYVPKKLGFPENGRTPFGSYITPSLFLSEGFAEWRGRIVTLTKLERRILLYLITCSTERIPADAEKIAAFCFPKETRNAEKIENRIAAHIYHINRKFEAVTGRHVLRDRRGAGYFPEGIF